jgi:hypothetical protein
MVMPKAKRELDAYTLRSAARTANQEARRLFRIAEATAFDDVRAALREGACAAVKIRLALLRRAERLERTQKRRGRA